MIFLVFWIRIPLTLLNIIRNPISSIPPIYMTSRNLLSWIRFPYTSISNLWCIVCRKFITTINYFKAIFYKGITKILSIIYRCIFSYSRLFSHSFPSTQTIPTSGAVIPSIIHRL